MISIPTTSAATYLKNCASAIDDYCDRRARKYKKSLIDNIFVLPDRFRVNKSLSPVKRCVAFPSFANDSKKLSFESRQVSTLLETEIIRPLCLISDNKMLRSVNEKYFLNLGRSATSWNYS